MFCCLLGRKFSRKCKHSVKCIKCRMEQIRKRNEEIVTFRKKVVADLISGGDETSAFRRMDALIVEINQSSCYDMIEQYCCCIVEHLHIMQKERVCPEETVEAIATLIFAAARFPNLPELADLRKEFTKRYGTNMEPYINEEFVEKMQKKIFQQDKKLRLMQDISQNSSIHWDLKPFEHKISNPLAPALDQPKIQFPSNKENIKQQDVKKAENFDYEELINAENIKEYQKIIQMTRSEDDPHRSTEKIAGKAPLNGTSTNQTTFSHSATLELDKEINHHAQGSQINRPFNLKPPYIKPKVTKNTSMETAHLMNTPFSVRRAAINGDFTVLEGDPLVCQIPIKQAGAVGKKNSLLGDVND